MKKPDRKLEYILGPSEKNADELVRRNPEFIVNISAISQVECLVFPNTEIEIAAEIYTGLCTDTGLKKAAELYLKACAGAEKAGFREIADRAVYKAIGLYLVAHDEKKAAEVLKSNKHLQSVVYSFLGCLKNNESPLFDEPDIGKDVTISKQNFPEFAAQLIEIGREYESAWKKPQKNVWTDVMDEQSNK